MTIAFNPDGLSFTALNGGRHEDSAAAQRVMAALLTMKKIDIAALRPAQEGK